MSETGGTEPEGVPPVLGWGRLAVHPGGGVVHRGPDVLLVVPRVTAAVVGVTGELLALCGAVPDPTGRRRIRRVARLLTEAEPDDLPAFAVVIDAGDHLAVLVHGDVTVSVTGGSVDSFSAAESLAWVERSIPGSYDTVSVGSASSQPGPTTGAPLEALPLDLLAGTVPGSGATLRRGAAAPPAPVLEATSSAQEVARVLERPAYLRPAGTAVPVSAPTGTEDTTPVPAGGPEVPEDRPEPIDTAGGRTVLRQTVQVKSVPLARQGRSPGRRRRQPLPVGAGAAGSLTAAHTPVVAIEGVLCPAGHLNDPRTTECAPCGASIDAAAPRVSQPRPPLGVLVTDEGAVYTVSTDFVIGRDPERAPDVVAGRARPVVLRDAENSTSRVHARLHLDGWEVLVTDSGSANGTFVSSSGPSGPWRAVHREPGTPLHPGDRVRLGKRQLLLDRYHLPASRLETVGREGSGGPRR